MPSLALGIWAFAISAWIPRSALALPATALVIAVLAWPAWLFFRHFGPVGPTAVEAWAFLALAILGAPLVAGFSFVCGYRYGARPRRNVALGLTAAVLAFSPAWAWTGVRLHRAHVVDPYRRGFTMNIAFVGAGERFAFVNAEHRQPVPVGEHRNGSVTRAMLADLSTGDWQVVGGIDSHWRPVGSTIISPEAAWLRESVGETLWDANTGQRVEGEAAIEVHPGEQHARELGLGPEWRVYRRAGLGYELSCKRGRGFRRDGFLDPESGRYVSRQDLFALHLARRGVWFPDTFRTLAAKRLALATEDAIQSRVWVRPGSWLLRARDRTFWRIEPESGRLDRILRSLRYPDDRLGPLLPDGDFLLVADGGVWLFDPESEERTPIEMPPRWHGRVTSMYDVLGEEWRAPDSLGASGAVLVDVCGAQSYGLARFVPQTRSFEFAAITRFHDAMFLAQCDDNSILVSENYRRIVRQWFGSDRTEVLFPR